MKYKKEFCESRNWFLGWIIITFLIICCILQSGCARTCRGFCRTVIGVGETVSGMGLDAEEALNNQCK